MALLQYILSIKTAELISSVICECIYIGFCSKDATISARVYFYINIVFGVCTIIYALSTIFVRRTILENVVEDPDEASQEGSSLENTRTPPDWRSAGSSSDGDGDEGDGHRVRVRVSDTGLEMSQVYKDSREGRLSVCDNPML